MDANASEKVRLLLVDDEAIRLVLARVFDRLGYQVTAAASGEEALFRLEQLSYDLMLLDLNMPGMGGVEVMRRAHEVQPELLIIVLTGHPTLDSAITAIKSEVVDYLEKNVSISDIIDAVTRALQKRSSRLQKENLDRILQDLPQLLNGSELNSASISMAGQNQSLTLSNRPLELNQASRSVKILDQPSRTIELTRGETAVLYSLMAYPDKPLTCQQLVQVAWGEKVEKTHAESIIRPYISRLRQKLETNPKRPNLIHTIRGRGYLFTTTG